MQIVEDSAMYLDHFGLQCPPFEETTNPRFCFEHAALKCTLDAVEAVVADRGGMVLVEAEPGSGRSLCAQVLTDRLPARALLLAATPDESSVISRIKLLCRGASPDDTDCDRAANEESSPATEIVAGLRDTGVSRWAWIIDDAERLDLGELQLLAEVAAASQAETFALTVVLIAAPAIRARLRLPELQSLTKCLVRVPKLERMQPAETTGYLATRLAAAGRAEPPLFTAEAVELIAGLTHGEPRRINELAAAALTLAAEQQITDVGFEVVLETTQAPTGARVDATALLEEPNLETESAMAATPSKTPDDLARMEQLVARFERLLADAPRRLAEFEDGATRTADRVDRLIHNANQRVEELHALQAQGVDHPPASGEELTQLLTATAEAQRLHDRLADFVQKLDNIDSESEDRITLLLNGLESAEQIHDQLETAREQVARLIEESRQVALGERDALLGVFDDLAARREELRTSLDALRHQRQNALEENERCISEMIERCRRDAKQACDVSADVLAQARTIAERQAKTLDEQAAGASERVAEGTAAAHALLRKIQTATVELEERQQAINDQAENLRGQLRVFGAAQDRGAELAGQVTTAEKQLAGATQAAKQASTQLARNLDRAAHLRDGCITTVERLQADGVRAIEETINTGDQRLRDGIARIEALVATEKSARTTAEEAVHSARAALAAVQAAEGKLAQAQASAIDIEATAATTLSTIQQRIKRFEDSVDVIINHGIERARAELSQVAESVSTQTAEARQALTDDVAAHREAVTAHVDTTLARAEDWTNATQARTQARLDELAQAIAHSAQQARDEIEEITNQSRAVSSAGLTRLGQAADDTLTRLNQSATEALDRLDQSSSDALTRHEQVASAALTELRQTVDHAQRDLAALAAGTVAQLEECVTTTADAIDARSTTAVIRVQEQIATGTSALESAAACAVKQLDAEASHTAAASRSAIDNLTARAEQQLERLAAEATDTARERILATATGAAQSLESEIAAATVSAEALAGGVETARKTLADAEISREKIDHQIRDVWSLAGTTDQRVRMLTALAEQADASGNLLADLIGDAARKTHHLKVQAEAARKSAETLTTHNAQVKGICEAFANRIAEAREVCAAVAAANSAGEALAPDLQARGEALQQLLGQAGSVVENIRAETETAQANTQAVQQMALTTANLEAKIVELQESLANPLGIIQDAQAQADELNEICLAVKRVFRGVSQASLQANERIKMLGKLLTATERSARTMQQWVQEAGRAQARLSDTIAQAPGIAVTHPTVALPAPNGQPAWPTDRGARIDANDRATIQRLADRPAPAPTAKPAAAAPPAGGSTGTATATVAPSATKTVEPLVNVLKAKQAAAEQSLGKRISPEQVQAMIAAAKREDSDGA
jgi:type II secretory pathway predicted ATPase ExeA/chromosome segregation ATPase